MFGGGDECWAWATAVCSALRDSDKKMDGKKHAHAQTLTQTHAHTKKRESQLQRHIYKHTLTHASFSNVK